MVPSTSQHMTRTQKTAELVSSTAFPGLGISDHLIPVLPHRALQSTMNSPPRFQPFRSAPTDSPKTTHGTSETTKHTRVTYPNLFSMSSFLYRMRSLSLLCEPLQAHSPAVSHLSQALQFSWGKTFPSPNWSSPPISTSWGKDG